MRIDLLDFPQVRTAPASVVQDLEAVDPSLALLHSRGPRWLLCRYAPDRIDQTVALAILKNWREQFDKGARYSREIHVRLRQARLALKGWKQIAVYDIANDDFGVVQADARLSRWLLEHTSDNALFRGFDDAADQKRDAAVADLTSLDRAKDAWKYAFTRSHRMGTSLTPTIGPRSCWKREITLS